MDSIVCIGLYFQRIKRNEKERYFLDGRGKKTF